MEKDFCECGNVLPCPDCWEDTTVSKSASVPGSGGGGVSIVRRNLMERKGYSPYCGSDDCRMAPRTSFRHDQFVCPHCGWISSFPKEFINEYKVKWNL